MSINAVNRSTEIAHVVISYLNQPVVQIFLSIQSIFEEHLHERHNSLKRDTWISDREFSSLDLTRHLTSAQRKALNQPLVSAQKVHEFVLQLHTEVGLSDLATNLENYALDPRYALIAHLKGAGISVEQVASRCLLYQAIRQFIKQRVVFVHYELPDEPQAVESMSLRVEVPNVGELPRLQIHRMAENDQMLRHYLNLTAEGVGTLFDRLQSKPLSERYYYAIPLPLGAISSWSPGYKRVVDILEFLRPVTVRGSAQFEQMDSQVMVIPSYSMLIESSKIRHKKNAISYIPLLGICTEEIIEFYKMLDLRVFHIGASGADVPDVADGDWHGPLAYSIHDYYHGQRDSWLRKLHRKAICFIVGILFDRPINENTRRIKWTLVNGELYEAGEAFGELFDRDRVPWDDAHILAVLTNMAALPAHWKKQFAITSKQLNIAEKNLYDKIALTLTTRDKRVAECSSIKYSLRPSKPRAWERRGSS